MWKNIVTPCYVVDKSKLVQNLEILAKVEKEAGCKILLAQKAFSTFKLYSLIGDYISGTTASGLYEARLGYEEMKKENHVFAPAYKHADMEELVKICDHIVFNSIRQLKQHQVICKENQVSIGLRINPEFSTQKDHEIYDPCSPGSRLGVTYEAFEEEILDYIDGFHFHTLCEQNSKDLVDTFQAFEKRFGKYLSRLKWLNLGGGHHITKEEYDRKLLVELIQYIKKTYEVEVYLEPGEAVALDAGYLVTEVLDIVHNGMDVLILDASAACHMPDVLEMPYRPPLRDGFLPGEKAFTYRLSSNTCLAGDVIGDYSFEHPIQIGDRLVFEDMAIYSMVKNNTFNGIPLPAIAILDTGNKLNIIKEFDYNDFKNRLS